MHDCMADEVLLMLSCTGAVVRALGVNESLHPSIMCQDAACFLVQFMSKESLFFSASLAQYKSY